MTVKVGNFSVTSDKILKQVGIKDIIVSEHVNGTLQYNKNTHTEYLEEFINMYQSMKTTKSLDTIKSFINFLLIQNNLKTVVNREVCRRDNFYHVFLYNEDTLEVTDLEMKHVYNALLEVEDMHRYLKDMYNTNNEFKNLIKKGYKVAYMTNKKFDWFFTKDDITNIANFHENLFGLQTN